MKKPIIPLFMIIGLGLGFSLLCAGYQTDRREWLLADLHLHSTRSDGARPPQEIVQIYARQGYDVLALTDHDYFDRVEFDRLQAETSLLLIPAIEYSYVAGGPNYKHLLMYFLDHLPRGRSRPEEILEARKQGALVFVAHPATWNSGAPRRKIDGLYQRITGGNTPADLPAGINGCEIYNEKLARAGYPHCPLWCLISLRGRSAGSDAHALSEYGKFKVWIHAERNLKSVQEALRQGHISLTPPPRRSFFSP